MDWLSKGRWWWFGVAAALSIGLMGVRAVHLEADPPADLAWGSMAIYTDEGYKLFHARNRFLFGRWNWSPDDAYTFWVRHSPVSLRVHTWWFGLVGTSDLRAARALHLLLGLSTLLGLAWIAGRWLPGPMAPLSVLPMGVSFLWSMYSRMVFLENLHMPLLVAAAGVGTWLVTSKTPATATALIVRFLGVAALVVAVSLGMGTKVSFLFPLAALGLGLVAVWLHRSRGRIALSHLFVAVLLGVISCMTLSAVMPGLTAALPLSSRSPVVGLAGLARNLGYMQLATRAPFLFAAGIIAALAQLSAMVTSDEPVSPLLGVAAVWLVFGILFMSLFEGNADRIRYYLVFLPPASLLAGWLVWSASRGSWTGGRRWVVWLVALHMGASVFVRLAGEGRILAAVRSGDLVRLTPWIGAGLACAVGLPWLWSRSSRAAVRALVVVGLAWNLGFLSQWLAKPPRGLQTLREYVAGELDPVNSILAGQFAPAAVLSSRVKALHLHYAVNLDRLTRLEPTHLLVTREREEETSKLRELYPGLLDPARLLHTFVVGPYHLDLYRTWW